MEQKAKRYIAKNQNINIIIVKKRKTNKYGIHKTKLKNITRDFDIIRMMAIETSSGIKEIEYNTISFYCMCTCQNNKNMCAACQTLYCFNYRVFFNICNVLKLLIFRECFILVQHFKFKRSNNKLIIRK